MKCSTAGIMPLLLKGLALFLCEVTQNCNLIASLTYWCIFSGFHRKQEHLYENLVLPGSENHELGCSSHK